MSAIVCCYFNFCHYDKITQNYHKFYNHVSSTTSIPLYTVELALSDEPWQLDSTKYKNLIRVRSNSILWHKERLLNVGIKKLLHEGFKKIIWSDADVIFTNKDWAKLISDGLETHPVVQGFDCIDAEFSDRVQSGESAMSHTLRTKTISGFSPGGVWAGTKAFLQNCGIYDKNIVGGGDAVFMLGCIPNYISETIIDDNIVMPMKHMHSVEIYKDYITWIYNTRQWLSTNGDAGVIRQKIKCLPHGLSNNRNYCNRHNILKDFSPSRDLSINQDGCYELNRQDIQDALKDYFKIRNDDIVDVENKHFMSCNQGANHMTKIIGLSGKKQSGKSTACNWLHALEMASLGLVDSAKIDERGNIIVPADIDGKIAYGIFDINNNMTHQYLSENLWGFIKQYSFADALKQFCVQVLGLSYESCYGTDLQKNKLTHILWNNMPGVIPPDAKISPYLRTKYGLYAHAPGPMSGREVLQFFGTDVCRKIYENCWVQATLNQIHLEQPRVAIIPDVRFEGEVAAIQKAGGRVIRLTRFATDADTHQSELELDDYTGFDYVLDNSNMSISEQNQAIYKLLVNDWKWLAYEEV